MKISDILDENRIVFGLKENTKEEIIREIATLFLNDGTVKKENFEKLIFDLLERENLSSTGMQEGIAIPHCKTSAVDKFSMAVAIDKKGKDFASIDDIKSTMFFMLIAPENSKREHLDILATISKLSFEDDLKEELLNTDSKLKVIEILSSL